MISLKKDEKIPGCGFSFVYECGLVALDVFEEHRRLRVFVHKGISCVTPNCQHVGSRLIFSRDKQGGGHWDLFTDDLILMTIDHIVARSNGGSNELENLQPMCSRCNTTKGKQKINLDELALQMVDYTKKKEAKKIARKEAYYQKILAKKIALLSMNLNQLEFIFLKVY